MSIPTSSHDEQITAPSEVLSDTRILIVDDDDILRGLHEAVLSMAGYGTQSAADGEEALSLLAIDEFDLIITDCRMPRVDGIELVRRVRAMGNRIPIIMVSASLNEGPLPEDIAREVSVALPKPARTKEILAAIVHALRRIPDGPTKAKITDIFPRTTDHHQPPRIQVADIFDAAA